MTTMNELIGKKITGLSRITDQVLIFDTPSESVAYQTDSECCSETWFDALEGVDNLIGHTVCSVEALSFGQIDDGDNIIQPYGYKVTTDAGSFLLIFRNKSNGYYGGSVILTHDFDKTKAIAICDDWSR